MSKAAIDGQPAPPMLTTRRASPLKPKRTHLELTSGRYLDYLDPQPEDICINDIALALSNSCRWGGHCERFYSIAEHACLVHDIVVARGGDHATRAAALHHDDHEAFVNDIPTPLKNVLGAAYYDVAERIDHAIGKALDIDLHCIGAGSSSLVKDADNLALYIEAERFKPSQGRHWEGRPAVVALPQGVDFICGMAPESARYRYLRRHYALRNVVLASRP